jgi:hypothetical protein
MNGAALWKGKPLGYLVYLLDVMERRRSGRLQVIVGFDVEVSKKEVILQNESLGIIDSIRAGRGRG